MAEWLRKQPQTTHRELTTLGALRTLPLALEAAPAHPIESREKPLNLGPVRFNLLSTEHANGCLSIFRAALTSLVAATELDQTTGEAAQHARNTLRDIEKERNSVLSTASHAASALKYASSVNSPDIGNHERSSKFAAYSLFQAWTLLRKVSETSEREEWHADPELTYDVSQLPAVSSRTERLFSVSQPPQRVSNVWLAFLEDATITTLPWRFWRDWYQGLLDGKQLDWELQRRVALIDNEVWNAGPEAVAAEIDRIRSCYELEQEIANLKEQLAIVQDTPAASLIGDNGGPPLEDAPARAFQTDLALIWKQVEELEEEIAKPSPSPSQLGKIAKALWDISRRMAAYCGSIADGMIREGSKEMAKAGAKWTAGATAVTFTAQTESVQSVAKAIWAFVKTLPPG
ncbi:hypothetical protein [Phaeobacter piscinae]|uniref:hypothetical protein n=1 Tax=Phaeobacter piscinae TaxID=1580596 RepID=UPI000F466633|nr:hypothetical protein [Phaeobacter piscinae]